MWVTLLKILMMFSQFAQKLIFVGINSKKVLPAFHFHVLVYPFSPLTCFFLIAQIHLYVIKSPETPAIPQEYDMQHLAYTPISGFPSVGRHVNVRESNVNSGAGAGGGVRKQFA